MSYYYNAGAGSLASGLPSGLPGSTGPPQDKASLGYPGYPGMSMSQYAAAQQQSQSQAAQVQAQQQLSAAAAQQQAGFPSGFPSAASYQAMQAQYGAHQVPQSTLSYGRPLPTATISSPSYSPSPLGGPSPTYLPSPSNPGYPGTVFPTTSASLTPAGLGASYPSVTSSYSNPSMGYYANSYPAGTTLQMGSSGYPGYPSAPSMSTPGYPTAAHAGYPGGQVPAHLQSYGPPLGSTPSYPGASPFSRPR